MVKVIAHRGARSIAPENTLIAAKLAYEIGADLWGTDVNVTRDNHLILFHDETLLRCTNAETRFPSRQSYRVKDFYLKDIMALNAGSFFNETDPFLQIVKGNVSSKALSLYKKETIPTLKQGLLFTKKMNWKVNLELKRFVYGTCDTLLPDKTLETIYQCGISLDLVVVSSFSHEWLERIRIKEPRIEVQALVGENDNDSLDFGELEFETYNVNANLVNLNQIKLLKDKGKRINLFTVNDPKIFSRFENHGVDGIFTDFPQLFSKKV